MAEKARAKYGDDYIVQIDKALRRAYAITKGIEGDKNNARQAPAMEHTVHFDVVLEKDGRKIQETISVKPLVDSSNDIKHIENERNDLIKGVEEKVFAKAGQVFEKEYKGLSVDIQPNYNRLTGDNASKQAEDTYSAVQDAALNIRDTIKGYEAVNRKNENTEYYFIIVNKNGEEPLVKTVAVDKDISHDEMEKSLKMEANSFINENVRSIHDLNGMAVHAEKANDLSDDRQREFYRQIGSRGTEKGFESSIEIAR